MPASAEAPALEPASADAPALEPERRQHDRALLCRQPRMQQQRSLQPPRRSNSATSPSHRHVAALCSNENDRLADEITELASHIRSVAIESASAEAPVAESALAEEPSLAERRTDALVLMADTLLAGEPNGRGGDRYAPPEAPGI